MIGMMHTPMPLAAVILQAAGETAGEESFGLGFGTLAAAVRVALLLFLGFPLVYGLAKTVRGWVTRNSTPQRGMIIGKLIFYGGAGIILVSTLTELGFSLAPLLGAAGIFGIALGFASQTSVSNVISGFFLMAEQPFVVDDVIQVGSTTGKVLSIDMMSVKLRTFDNRFVRIPNESIVKSEVTNVTRFPIRRLDTAVGVAYREDIGKVRSVLLDVARRNRIALMDPEPVVIFQGYGDSSIDLLFVVWTTKENFGALRNTLFEEIKRRFDEEGIEIPFPQRTLYLGAETGPLPVRLLPAEPGDGPPSSPGDTADLLVDSSR